MNRCANKSNKDYGAKGIIVCDEWLKGFECFYSWSMNHGYTDNLQIDRIDSTGNYTPDNCRWVTSKVNGRNRSSTFLVDFRGQKIAIGLLAEMFNLNYGTLTSRLTRSKWDVEKAIQPVKK